MALSRFPAAMSAAVDAVLRTAEVLRAIRDQQGDLTLLMIDRAQDCLRSAKLACLAALTEGAKAPEAAEAYMAALGGPATLAGFQSALVAIEIKAGAWHQALEAALQSMAPADLVRLGTRSDGGVETRYVEWAGYLPAALADPLRTSPALTDLVAAFEGAGA